MALFAASTLAGCYQSNASGDAGTSCEPVGTLVRCNRACGGHWLCPELPGARFVCVDELCMALDEPPPPPLRNPAWLSCTLPLEPGVDRVFSLRGDVACAPSEFFTGDSGRGIVGLGVAEPDCDALEREFGRPCWWSDGTVRTRTPESTHATCPVEPTTDAPASVLCGGACAHCGTMAFGDERSYDTACVGRNDDRELGVCAIMSEPATSGCSPEQHASSLCEQATVSAALTSEWGTDRCACLSFLREDGFERAGWVVPDTNCLTYRALYPGQVECYDDDWNPLP